MWSVSLSHDNITQVFEPGFRKVSLRYPVRRIKDAAHVYCIVESPASMTIVRVGLDPDDPERINIEDIYESHSSRIIIVEPDPDDFQSLFVLDDEQKLHKITDKMQGKV